MRAIFTLLFAIAATIALGIKLGASKPVRIELSWSAISAADEDNAGIPPPPPQPAAPPQEIQLALTLVGDTGLNASAQPVYASSGRRSAWQEASAAIATDLAGDIVFANLETVVTDSNDLPAQTKRFVFRTHPDGVRHLASLGFNAFSTANNHAMDYGTNGARETLKHLDALTIERGVIHAGLGLNRVEAASPRVLVARGAPIALSAIGIAGGGYGSPMAGEADDPGHLSYPSNRDFEEAVDLLSAQAADFRILSVHYGQEFEPKTAGSDRSRFAGALARGTDLVVGHHQHVVAGVEARGEGIIFYGLGNFLHLGTQDMSRFDVCRDYGLIARVHLAGLPGERLSVRAIEAIPIAGMHRRTRRLTGEAAHTRIHVLNHLAKQFDEGASRGVRFAPLDDGTGLYCAQGSDRLSGRIGALCKAPPAVSEPSAERAAEIERACSRHVVRTVENEAEPDLQNAAFPSK